MANYLNSLLGRKSGLNPNGTTGTLGAQATYPVISSPKNTLPTNQTKTSNTGLMGGLISGASPLSGISPMGGNPLSGIKPMGTTTSTSTQRPLSTITGGNTPYQAPQNTQYIQDPNNPNASIPNRNYVAPTAPTTGTGISGGGTNTEAIQSIMDEINRRNALNVPSNQTMNQFNAAQNVGAGVGAGVGTGTQPVTYSAANPPTVGGTSATLANLINNPSPAVQAAQDALQKFKANVAEQTRQVNTSGTWTGRALGEQQQYATQNAAIEASLQGALDNALKQQEQGITALTAAQGAIAPQAYGVTTTPYNPATGTYGTMAGTTTGAAGLQAAGNVAAQVGIGQNVGTLNSYLGGAQTVGKQLTDLITANNLNPSDIQVINGAIQWLQSGVLSDPKYQELTGQINDFVSSIAPILGTGGSVTDMKTQMSAALVNAKANGQSINDVVNYFLESAKQKIQGYQTGGGAGYGTQGTTGNSIYDF